MLARSAGVGIATVRYYQRRGLLNEPGRSLGRVRTYSEEHLLQLWVIRHGKDLGFTLSEIGELSAHVGEQNCRAIRTLAERKLRAIEARIRQLDTMRETLKAIVSGCRNDGKCDGNCPILQRFRTNGFDPVGDAADENESAEPAKSV